MPWISSQELRTRMLYPGVEKILAVLRIAYSQVMRNEKKNFIELNAALATRSPVFLDVILKAVALTMN
jgi:ribosomal protein S20